MAFEGVREAVVQPTPPPNSVVWNPYCDDIEIWAKFRISLINKNGIKRNCKVKVLNRFYRAIVDNNTSHALVGLGTENRFHAAFQLPLFLGSECYTRHCKSLVPFSPMNPRLGFSNFISVLALNIHVSDLLPSGAITLFCEVELEPDMTLIPSAQRHVITASQLASIGLLEKMMEDTLFSDVTLVSTVDAKEHKAHRAVLAACSPVFKAMFENETQVRCRCRIAASSFILYGIVTFMVRESVVRVQCPL